jgi:hypothetical protein
MASNCVRSVIVSSPVNDGYKAVLYLHFNYKSGII